MDQIWRICWQIFNKAEKREGEGNEMSCEHSSLRERWSELQEGALPLVTVVSLPVLKREYYTWMVAKMGGGLLVCISFAKAKCRRSQKPMFFRVCFNYLSISCVSTSFWVPGQLDGRPPDPQIGNRNSALKKCQGDKEKQQHCSVPSTGEFQAEEYNTQSFCKKLVRLELLVLWKQVQEWNGSYTNITDWQALRTSTVPPKILARKTSYKSRL